jgi:hypothetical protein
VAVIMEPSVDFMPIRMRRFLQATESRYFSSMRAAALCASLCAPGALHAATYLVGPGRTHASLNALFDDPAIDLNGGDVVLVDGGVTYGGDVILRSADQGAPGNPLIIRGVRDAQGRRPILQGGVNTIEFRRANHVVLESIEVTGSGDTLSGTFRCVYHNAHDIVLRDVLVRDCPRNGVLGSDQGSGSLTIEFSEIRNAGSRDFNHAIYMSTDQVAFPGAVFRLQHSWVHDSRFDDAVNGGNLIKSRAERNEIYYNWLEDAFQHELELIGPDPAGVAAGWTSALRREDSDVVGNVIVHSSATPFVIRVGGDGTSGTGDTNGRYRFVGNTIVGRSSAATLSMFRTHFGVLSLQMHNNVLWREGAGTLRIWREETPTNWVNGVQITGSHNWIQTGATFVPSAWTQTYSGANPLFSDLSSLNLIPALASPLLDVGTASTQPPADHSFPGTLAQPQFVPVRALRLNTIARAAQGTIDLGAFERADENFANGFEDTARSVR